MPEMKVLLVEDSETDATLIGAQLRSDGRFSVARVSTLSAACDWLHTSDAADVVILDLNLSDSMGLETFTTLHREFPDTPVVILTGDEDEELAVAAVRHGAQDYVPKNKADADTLARSVRYAIERNARRFAERRNLLWERDLATAREIQQHMLPTEPPRVKASTDKLVSVLHVEDDIFDVELLRRIFAKHSVPNPLHRAADGIEALEILRGEKGREPLERPYVILLDMQMPRMDGIEFLRELRADPQLKDSVVFMLTTFQREAEQAAAYEYSVAGYLVKEDIGEDGSNLVDLLQKYWRLVEFPAEKQY